MCLRNIRSAVIFLALCILCDSPILWARSPKALGKKQLVDNAVLEPAGAPAPQDLSLIGLFNFQTGFEDSSPHAAENRIGKTRVATSRTQLNSGNIAAHFNGTTGYFRVVNLAGLSRDNVTVSLWAQTDNPLRTLDIPPYQGTLISLFNGNFAIDTQSGPDGREQLRYYLQMDDTSEVGNFIPGMFGDHRLHHIVATYEGSPVDGSPSHFKVFLDGDCVVDQYLNRNYRFWDWNISELSMFVGSNGIAKDYPLPSFFKGNIDQVMIYNRAITDAEVENLYLQQVPSMFNAAPPLSGKAVAGADEEWTQAMAKDSAGDVYLAGGTRLANDARNIPFRKGFLSKISGKTNEVLWTKTLAGTGGYSAIQGVATDSQNNVIVTGYFTGDLYTSPATRLTAIGRYDIFVVKYDAEGLYRWGKRYGGNDTSLTADLLPSESGVAVAVDLNAARASLDDIAITGSYQGLVDFGGLPVFSKGGTPDAFLLKLTKSGTYRWAKTLGSSENTVESGTSVMIEPSSGDSIWTANFNGSLTLGNNTPDDPTQAFTSVGGSDVLLTRHADSTGTVRRLWSKRIGGVNDDTIASIAMDNTGNVVVGGTLGSMGSMGAQNADIFLGKYAGVNGGVALWERTFGTERDEAAFAVAVDAQNNILLAGRFDYLLSLDNKFTMLGGNDAFVAKFSAAGTNQWTKQLGSWDLYDAARGLVINADGTFFVGGSFYQPLELGFGLSLPSSGNLDAFLIRYSP